ncbi:hypothetical protein BW721_06235 [Jeotgalibaca sp. PTS2502]|uniref:hypothetical protein n=1 Tax=Jeotgalibaca sp. PTS2502 TaxID=1903686 RepID=UPI000973ADBE|nr:hypothetical protein [Jeotgalibaca sp. PTS2502]APZ49308.1 hypothetical protein BW721_06235 [Jeotgalibaca sp. PTS2502]
MKKLIFIAALLGTFMTGSQLSGTPFTGVTAGSTLLSPQVETVNEIVIVEESIEETVEESVIEDVVEPALEEVIIPEKNEVNDASIEEQPVVIESTEEELTYDQIHQKDVGEEEEVVPEEVVKTWYIAETAEEGLQLILETYELEEYSFVIDSTPSNFVYQYDFYMDSPDGEHANLVHIFQYDATGKALFQLDLITGEWQ